MTPGVDTCGEAVAAEPHRATHETCTANCKMTVRAIGYTMVVVLTLLFFYRHIQFSPIFVLTGCILMLAMSFS